MDYSLNVFVTKDLMEKKQVGFMYREKPDNTDDSGWRFFSGDESQEYVDNVDNIVMCSISDVIGKIDASIVQYLDCGIGSAFERKNINSDFSKVENFGFKSLTTK